MLIILCGKSASGKDAISKELIKNNKYKAIVSTTSRPMRVGEQEGREYYFIDKSDFEQGIAEDKFIEYRAYNTTVNNAADTWFYGTKKFDVDDTDKLVAIKDLKGAEILKKYYTEQGGTCYIFYIDAISKVRTERAKSRGSFDEIEWNRRLGADEEDFKLEDLVSICDFSIDNNENTAITLLAEKVLKKIEK